MAEASQYIFPFTELTELMIKKQGVHEGFWSIYVKFGMNAANVSLNSAAHAPTAIVPILEIGIQLDPSKGPLAVDAASVNPAQSRTNVGGLAMGKAKSKSPVKTRLS